MWFVDPALKKNRKYYQSEIDKYIKDHDYNLKLYYGKDYFYDFDMQDMWDELTSHLRTYRKSNSKDVISIPDFDKSEQILDLLTEMD